MSHSILPSHRRQRAVAAARHPFPTPAVAALLLAALLILLSALPAPALELAGKVTRIQGEATVQRGQAPVPLAVDDAVFVGDALSTGVEARLELEMNDGTLLTLSDNTHFSITEMDYAPGTDGGHALLNLASGAFRAVTGRLTDTVNPDFTVNTPLASIGIRGTDFWGGFLSADALDVFLIDGHNVVVRNERGTTVLAKAGEGTTVGAMDEAPGPVKVWPQDKVDRAVATVMFND